MKVYHQTGFRYKWNIESFLNGVGNGLIYSPINIDADKLLALDVKLKHSGFLDPQLYLLYEAKGTLDTYPYFPGNIKPDFATPDLDNSHIQLAQLCVDYQVQNNFEYLIIPSRYYTDNPTTFFSQSTDYFVTPFCDYIRNKNIQKKILLSVIVKTIMLSDEEKRNEVLNWITGHQNIEGVYLILENNFTSKQIKDFDYLLNALKFIKVLKDNQMEVHLGYSNTEALLYSIAMPDSVTIGSYENLRSFGIKRFQDMEKSQMRAPNARLYSSYLLQWVDYEYIQAMKKLMPDYANYFDDSEYRPLMFTPEFKWHFAKSEPYKHYFYVFDRQIKSLPSTQEGRIEELKCKIKNALTLFKKIENEVLLDENSDGSHLPTWFNVINAFQKELTK
ncbi:MAG: hypothetical protein GX296_02180 [Bacteroidales bacterium]|jgi:hypothetical protein|nr:hypothetical protein [Bacteroidales bacterium]